MGIYFSSAYLHPSPCPNLSSYLKLGLYVLSLVYLFPKPTVGRPSSKKAKAEKEKTAFTKEASSGKQGRKRGRPKGTNVSTVGQSQQTLSAFFYGSV